jgi:hypothetical protein
MQRYIICRNGGADMNVTYFNPTSTSGPDGFINFKLSGGGSGRNGGNGPGCGIWVWIIIILFVLDIFGRLS